MSLQKSVKINTKEIKKYKLSGIHGAYKEENIPNFASSESEQVISKGNSWIVLGRDRPAGISSGYGGKGDSRASSIDLVVGRQGWDPKPDSYVENNFGSFSHKNKPGDAARIYISQRADIDDYFGIATGQGRSTAQSAIGMIADDVRIISRRGIKLVTGNGPKQQDSLGKKVNFQFGVDIIAGNIDVEQDGGKNYLQPMVKGDNLTEALEKMNQEIISLNSLVNQFITLQMKMNNSIITGIRTGFSGTPISASVNEIVQGIEVQIRTVTDVIMELILQRNVVLNAIQLDYLSSYGSDYICSRHNRVN